MSATDPSPAVTGPVEGLFDAIDSMDAANFVAYLTEDARFRFGSAPEAQGRAAIAEAVGGFFASIAGLKHHIDLFLVEGETIVCEGSVTYTRHDGSTITLPFADVFDMRGDL
ncbi:MAG: nuclear transport factor 2 family protein, partial [Pseudomonadota bacterium]